MRIGLVDVDGHNFPNLALMKLSAWHKSIGDEVEWADPMREYGKVYKSKVFTWTEDYPYFPDAEKGGTGYGDYSKTLPYEIEHIMPDYSLYGITDTGYGFTTRGCPRHCPFCLVHDKEGHIRPNAEIEEFLPDGWRRLVLMDNNIVAHTHGVRQLEKCRDRGIAVDVNQGMDARIICKSESLIDLVASLRILDHQGIRIACDQDSEIEPCHEVIQGVLKRNPKAEFVVYCILTEDREDSMMRVMQWRRYGHSVAVYAPPRRDFDDPHQVIPRWQKDLSRWASNHFVYYGCTFEEYEMRKGRNRQKETLFEEDN